MELRFGVRSRKSGRKINNDSQQSDQDARRDEVGRDGKGLIGSGLFTSKNCSQLLSCLWRLCPFSEGISLQVLVISRKLTGECEHSYVQSSKFRNRKCYCAKDAILGCATGQSKHRKLMWAPFCVPPAPLILPDEYNERWVPGWTAADTFDWVTTTSIRPEGDEKQIQSPIPTTHTGADEKQSS